MQQPWNLTAAEWASVLGAHRSPASLAQSLREQGPSVPWTDLLLKHTADCGSVLDLGSGQGEHSVVLATNGRWPTLVDWSARNLQFSRNVFEASGVRGTFCLADISRPLPFATGSVDAVFSCGVLEYFTPTQVESIVREAFRVARRRVIVLVPNALSLAYRLGKWYMERNGTWRWGGEIPAYTLKRTFSRAGAVRVTEFSVAARHALDFLVMPFGDRIKRASIRMLDLEADSRPARCRQGYLLVTIGEKSASAR